MKTVALCWAEYEALVLPKDAPPVQRSECRLAFYAGVESAFSILETMDETMSDDAMGAFVNGCREECRQLARDYGAEKGMAPSEIEALLGPKSRTPK